MQNQATTSTAGGPGASPGEAPFADRARELAAAADALAAGIRAFHAELRAADSEPVRRAGFRCDEAAGSAGGIAADMRETAADLERIAAASAPGTCSVPWGVCPVHGNTLTGTGGRSWCRHPGCGRQWDYDRGGLPCAESAAWTVSDQSGASGQMCDGHAVDAHKRLLGAQVTPLAECGTHGTETGR